MKVNPVLEEIWRIKDGLAREADCDINRYCEQLRAWSAAHPYPGPVVHNAEELRRLAAGACGIGNLPFRDPLNKELRPMSFD